LGGTAGGPEEPPGLQKTSILADKIIVGLSVYGGVGAEGSVATALLTRSVLRWRE